MPPDSAAAVAVSAPARHHPADFEHAPFLVIWEVTRACALACVHCRADAIARRDPRELSTAEAFALIDQIRQFGVPSRREPRVEGPALSEWLTPRVEGPALSESPTPRVEGAYPLFVLTGGDPMWRKDLREIVGYAARGGLTVALTPSGTAAATRKRLEELRDAGLSRVAVSLDGPDPETHDAFRRVRGSFANTMKIIDAVVDLGLPLQINTTVSRHTLPTLERMAERVAAFPLALWAAFFLVQTGRGSSLDQISAGECEGVLGWLWKLARGVPFGIKTTEAPHYRRVVWQATRTEPSPNGQASERPNGARRQTESRDFEPSDNRIDDASPARQRLRATRAVNDGNGFVFIDHVGNICPSGFLPMVRGNVRDGVLVHAYRDDPVFRRLREPATLEGKCGRCRFRAICGGSRARAFTQTGNAFGSDPLCAYEPGHEVEDVVEY